MNTDTIKAGVWVRVSSGGQDEENQVPSVQRYCVAKGYAVVGPDNDDAVVYQDPKDVPIRYVAHAKSAYKGEQQTTLDRVIEDIRAGIIQVLVIWHSDRLERREGEPYTSALMVVLAEIAKAGGKVESVKESTLGQLDFGGKVTTFIAGLVNHDKSQHIADQVAEARARTKANGGIWGQGGGWGFDVVGEKYNKKLVPNDEGWKYVPGIFERVAAGDSLAKVASWIESETGQTWWPRTVSLVIRNPAWRGQVCDRDGRLIHRVDPVVPADLWRRANEALTAARTKTAGPPGADTSLLSALAVCGNPDCDATGPHPSPMYRIVTRDGAFYRCSGRGRARRGCGNMVRQATVDRVVEAEMSKSTRPVTTREFVPGQNYDAQIEAVGYELKSLPGLELGEEEEDQRRAQLRAERKELQDRPSTPDRYVMVETGRTFGEVWCESTIAQKRAFLKAHSDDFKIHVGSNDTDFAIVIVAPDILIGDNE